MGGAERAGARTSLRTAREAAFLRGFELVVDVQSAAPGAVAEIASLRDLAVDRRWDEVVRVAFFAEAVAARMQSIADERAAVQRLLAQAERDGATVWIANALAMRALLSARAGDPRAAARSKDDLVQATVMLESAGGHPMERISAHNTCAQAYSVRWLWELCDDQYAAALALAPDPAPEWANMVLPAIIYNRAEMQLNWACVLYQLGDVASLSERWSTWQTVMSGAPALDMPPSWSIELEALRALLAAVAGQDTADAAHARLAVLRPEGHPGAWPMGWLHLAIAVSDLHAGRRHRAAQMAELAVEEIDGHESADAYDLAMFVAAVLEAGDLRKAALRYGRRQLELRWGRRMAELGSTLERIQAERLRQEHDLVTKQAHLDDLTTLLNRRGFSRYLESIVGQEAATTSLFVADLDHFKLVNDRYGHQLGDRVLVTVGRLLSAHVRPSDCAVRLGGDEFAVVLANTPLEVARERAEALAEAVRGHEWHDLAPGLRISVSGGVAAGSTTAFADLMERADRALYEAKRRGRDRVECDSAVPALR